MLLSLHHRISRLSLVAIALVCGPVAVASAQSNTCCDIKCSKKCCNSCSDCPSVGSCCPNPGSLLPNPSPLEMDPSTRPLTMPDPANPNAPNAPNANPPGDAFAFSPLQSSLGTPDQVAVPNMMGNLLRAYRGITFQYLQAGDFAISNSSGSVTFRNTKIAENNSAIPRDRVGVRYNYFRNALTVRGIRNTPLQGDPVNGLPFIGANPAMFDLDSIARFAGEGRVARGVGTGAPTFLPGVAPAAKDYDLHLYTFEAEKTFLDGLASIGIRIPFADGLSEDQDFTAGVVQEDFLISATGDRTLGTSGGEWQDIQLVLKGILTQDPSRRMTISGGLGLTLPTGPNLNASVVDYSGDVFGDPGDQNFVAPPGNLFAFDMRIRDFIVENETFELSPFLAIAQQPNDRTFINGFAQIDIPLNESDWYYRSQDVDLGFLGGFDTPGNVPFSLANSTQNIEEFRGTIRDQTLMHLDIGGGYWLYQNPYAQLITGLAAFTELHYTTTLQDADIVTVPASRLTAQPGQAPEAAPRIGNVANRIDILDVTLGTHIQIGNRATFAVGGVLPLRDGDDRTFDVEVNAQLNVYR